MTEKQMKDVDDEMTLLWKQYIYEKAMQGDVVSYRHLDEIIRSGSFIKKYVQCDKNIQSYWIFILCDGEFGFFDGVYYEQFIPVSLAKLLNVDKFLNSKEFRMIDGHYELNIG